LATLPDRSRAKRADRVLQTSPHAAILTERGCGLKMKVKLLRTIFVLAAVLAAAVAAIGPLDLRLGP